MMGEPAIYSGQPVRSGLSRTLRGFSLVELMVTIAVVAVLLAIAVPSFNNATLGGKLSSYANNFVASAHLARSEAIKRNAAVTLCVSTNGTSCAAGGWEQGWIVRAADGTVIQRQQALPTGLKVTEAGGAAILGFQFDRRGDDFRRRPSCYADGLPRHAHGGQPGTGGVYQYHWAANCLEDNSRRLRLI